MGTLRNAISHSALQPWPNASRTHSITLGFSYGMATRSRMPCPSGLPIHGCSSGSSYSLTSMSGIDPPVSMRDDPRCDPWDHFVVLAVESMMRQRLAGIALVVAAGDRDQFAVCAFAPQ